MGRIIKFFLTLVVVFGFAVLTFWRFKEGIANKRAEQLDKRKFVSSFERLNRPRNFFDERIRELYNEPQASLLSGIVLGTKASFPPDLYSAMRRAGVLHVIALSGQNISILISVVSGFLLPFLGRRRAAFFSIITIASFIWFVGPSASVIRAGIMGSLAMIAILFGREYISLFGLLLTALVMIFLDPTVISDIGFQLSFAASLGIMVLGGGKKTMVKDELRRGVTKETRETKRGLVNENARRLKGYFAEETKTLLSEIREGVTSNLRVTLAAQIFTFPIMAVNFKQVSVISPLVNVLVVWLVPTIMIGGAFSVFSSFIIHFLGRILGFVVWVPLTYFIWVVEVFGDLSFSSFNFPDLGVSFGFFYYGVLFVVLAKLLVGKKA